MHGSACPPIKPWILQKGWWIVIYHHLSQYYLKKFTLYFFSGLGTFSKITKLKKICDLNYGWMEIFSIFWLKDMKSALKNESKDTGCKNRDWNQGRSDFKPLCHALLKLQFFLLQDLNVQQINDEAMFSVFSCSLARKILVSSINP